MSKSASTDQNQHVLLPHQASFIEQFLADPSKPGHLLLSDVGLGSTFTAANLVQRVMALDPEARILVLTPKAMQSQMQNLVGSVDVEALKVDRFLYREMQNATPDGSTVWREGGVFILSIEFAGQEDIARSLNAVSWTLLVVDEAHLLRGVRARLAAEVAAASPDVRILLVSSTPVVNVEIFGIGPFIETNWRRSEMFDDDGKPLFKRPNAQLQVIEFQMGPDERQLSERVQELTKLLGNSVKENFIGKILLKSLASGPASLESRLRNLRRRLTDGTESLVPDESEETAEAEPRSHPTMPLQNVGELLEALDDCLAKLESVAEDAKLESFIYALTNLCAGENPPTTTCIVTEHIATLGYLQARLEDEDINCHVIRASMPANKQLERVNEFKREGGPLLITAAALNTGIDLPEIEFVILYDLPSSRPPLERLYGRFQRIGRTTPLRLGALHDLETQDSDFETALDYLRKLITGEIN